MKLASIKILYCVPGHPDEDSPHFFTAAYWLKSQGFDVHIVCGGGRGANAKITKWGSIPVKSLPDQTAKFQKSLLYELVKSRTSGDCYVYYMHRHMITPAAYLGLWGLPRHQIIYHTQDFIEPGRHPHWEFFERRFARRAGWVISNEINRARALMSIYRLETMPSVVRTALPRDWPRPSRDLELRSAILARVGQHDSETCRLIMHEAGYATVRCGHQLLEALRLLPSDYILVFTGMDSNSEAAEKLKNQLGRFDLLNRVVVLERIPFDDLMRHTACCDAGILLYPNDGIGNFYQCPGRLTHYLGSGLPVVASNFPGFDLLNCKYDIGVTCDPQSPAAIADAIKAVAGRSRQELDRHAATLKVLALGELAYEIQAGRITEIIEESKRLGQR